MLELLVKRIVYYKHESIPLNAKIKQNETCPLNACQQHFIVTGRGLLHASISSHIGTRYKP